MVRAFRATVEFSALSKMAKATQSFLILKTQKKRLQLQPLCSRKDTLKQQGSNPVFVVPYHSKAGFTRGCKLAYEQSELVLNEI